MANITEIINDAKYKNVNIKDMCKILGLKNTQYNIKRTLEKIDKKYIKKINGESTIINYGIYNYILKSEKKKILQIF